MPKKRPEIAETDRSAAVTVGESPRLTKAEMPAPPGQALQDGATVRSVTQGLPGGPAVGEKNDPRRNSPLGVYMLQNKLSERLMCRALGLSLKSVQDLAQGKSLPTLPVAWEIERITKGVVPMESWLGMPRAQALIRNMRAGQPEPIQKWTTTLQPVVGVEPRRPQEDADGRGSDDPAVPA